MSLRPRRRVPCWAALLLALVAQDARAQGCDPETHVAPVDAALHSYTGDEQDSGEPRGQSLPHNCQQQFRLFLPTQGERPRTGWPVLVCTTLGGYVGASINRCIDKTTLQGKALDHGIAVIMAGMTLSTETMTCEEGQEQIPGHGMFHPPGLVPPGVAFAPYDSPDWAMPEKDAVMLVQHVRHQGGRPGLLADVDPHRVAVRTEVEHEVGRVGRHARAEDRPPHEAAAQHRGVGARRLVELPAEAREGLLATPVGAQGRTHEGVGAR
ncbi:MAG TPA: hypothetical protein VFF36_19555, partial [Planctomycetota bacterium]|nr:hypothetical protein [Planctomycetota bacterium]